MSFSGEYETSKVGPTTAFTLNLSGGAVKVIRLRPAANGRRTSFAIRAKDAGARIRQSGSAGVTIDSTDVGMQISTTMRWRVDVEADSEVYLAVRGDDAATTATLEVTKISDCADYASGETPAFI